MATRTRTLIAGLVPVVAALAGLSALAIPAAPAAPLAGVRHVFAAATNPGENDDAPNLLNVNAADNANNNVGDFLKYTAEAQALPVTAGKLHWQSRGPFGIDMPAGFSQSGERFGRVTGMGAVVTTAPNNPDVVYIGNMGGLWRSTDAGTHWTNITDGKLPRQGIGAIAVDPTDPNTIYAGTGISYLTLSGDVNGTGVYVTHDLGKHWTRPKQATQGYGSNALVATRTAVFYGSNRGLFRLDKTHPANGFVAVPLPTGSAGFLANWVSDIAVKPDDANEISVAVGFPLGKYKLPSGAVASPGNGIYRSTNGGTSFTKLAATGLGSSPTGSSDPIGRIRLAYETVAGHTSVLWAAVSDAGLAAGKEPASLDVVAATPAGNLNKTGTTFNGLYRSNDDGATWKMKANPQTMETSENSLLAGLGALGYGIGVQGFYNLWVATDPKVADQVYLGLEEVFQSLPATSGDDQLPAHMTTVERYADLCGFLLYYQNVPPTYGVSCPDQAPIVGGMSTHPDQHAGIAVATADGTRLYTGNDGGFFKQDSHTLTQSIDPTQVGFDNKNWSAVNDISTTEPYHVALKPDGEIIAALQDNGSIFVPKGSTHGIEVCGGDGVYVLPTPNPDVWYCTTPNDIIYYTADHGKTITAIPPGAVGDTNISGANFTSPVAIDPTDPNHLVAAAETVWETTKGTNTQVLYDTVATGTIVKSDWTQSYDAGTSPNKSPATGKNYPWSATALAVRGANIYDAVCGACRGAFTNPSLLLSKIATNVKPGCTAAKASTDCWRLAKSIGLPKGWVTSIVIDPKNVKTIYVAVGQQNPFEFSTATTGSAKVLVSHDAGDHFTDITGNLPRTEARGLVVRGNQLIVATEVGVFADAIGDGKWTRLGAGLPFGVGAHDLYVDPSGKHLLVALYGRGAWELTYGSTAVTSTSGGAKKPASGGGRLSDTGLSRWVPLSALGLVGAGLAAVRRRRRRSLSPR
ncbi:MAG: hypothetical protein QOD07_1993 [Frankiaceae bacterium]|jgi:hypothetical protein|nr:hypothetical protein [Frankiaceae bacterium]